MAEKNYTVLNFGKKYLGSIKNENKKITVDECETFPNAPNPKTSKS